MGFAMRFRENEAKSPPVAIGIDLGTSSSRVGLWRDGDVVIVPNERGKLATPTCVAFTDGGVVVGEAALEQASGNLENTIFAPQQLLGSKFENPWVQWHMRSWPNRIVRGGADAPLLRVRDRGRERLVRPEEVVTMLIEQLRKLAERFLGAPAHEAVVTIPAQYGRHQRKALLEACQAAKLKVLDLIKSPSAAGIAFALTNPLEGRRNLLICDMGASYFDFVLLTVDDRNLLERAVGTDYVDLDNCLLRFCKQDLMERFSVSLLGMQATEMRLKNGCEVAKRKLSQWNQSRVEVNDIVEGVDYSVTISRGHFEDFCRHDFELLLDPIDWCLEDCGLDRAEVDVVLVGGSARIPRVRRAVRDFFYGRSPREVLRPDHAAVLGAAVYVTTLSDRCAGKESSNELRDICLSQVWDWADQFWEDQDGESVGGCGYADVVQGKVGSAAVRSPPSPAAEPSGRAAPAPAADGAVALPCADDGVPPDLEDDLDPPPSPPADDLSPVPEDEASGRPPPEAPQTLTASRGRGL